MKESNYKKLIDAGFRIFRIGALNKEIREAKLHESGCYLWAVHSNYKTVKACNEAFEVLLKNNKHLEA